MRVLKTKKGYVIDDAPMIITGDRLVSQFLSDLDANESRNPNHIHILEQCKETVAGRKMFEELKRMEHEHL